MTDALQSFDQEAMDDGRLVPAKRRVRDATQSYSIHLRLKRDNDLRDIRRAKVLKLHSGAPPIPEKNLKAKGETWRSNINFREHEAKINELSTIFYDLFDRVPHIPLVTCMATDDLEVNRRYGKRISEAFNKLLTDFWDGFFDEMEAGINEMLNFDFQPFFHADDISFMFEHVKANALRLPSGTKSNPGKWPLAELLWSYEVHELWKRIQDKETRDHSKEVGWIPEGIEKAIMASTKDANLRDKFNHGEWLSFEEQIINNDLHFSLVKADPVQCVQQFILEMDGTIRHVIFYKNSDLGIYLYDRETDFESFRNFFSVFYYDVKSLFHARRGVGEKIYNLVLMGDIINNDIVDTARLDGSVMFKGRKNSEDRKMKWAKFLWLEEGTDIVRNPAEDSIQGPLGVSRYLSGKLNNNINLADTQNERESVQPLSAEEIRTRQFRQGGIQRSHITRFYRAFDRLLQEVWRRLISTDYTKHDEGWAERELFLDELEEKNVPRSALDSCTVKAFRSVGFGSAEAFDRGTQELLALAANMDESKRTEALHMRVAAVFDYDTANHFFPIDERDLDDEAENTLITLVINDLREGTNVAVESGQRHTKHALAVISFLEEVKQTSQDITQLFAQFSVGIANLAEHLNYMSTIPVYSRDLQRLRPVFNDLIEDFKEIQAAANDAAQEQQDRQAEMQAALAQAEAQKVDPDVLAVLKKFEVDKLDTQLQHIVRLQKAADRHNERLAEVQGDIRTDRIGEVAGVEE